VKPARSIYKHECGKTALSRVYRSPCESRDARTANAAEDGRIVGCENAYLQPLAQRDVGRYGEIGGDIPLLVERARERERRRRRPRVGDG